ncbi:MAG: hypothetical protein IPK95_13660 [Cellvibrionales bacterium]|nr:hypothetical protein [Cellvibrionales bacterium]
MGQQVPTIPDALGFHVPGWLAFLLVIQVGGFFHYWLHRLAHESRALWLPLPQAAPHDPGIDTAYNAACHHRISFHAIGRCSVCADIQRAGKADYNGIDCCVYHHIPDADSYPQSFQPSNESVSLVA